MPKVTLTTLFVRAAACPPGRAKIDFFDVDQRGFMLEVRSSGGKTFYQRYRNERGRERQFKIGPADAIRLEQARRKARQVLAEAVLGPDPQCRRQELRSIPTFSTLIKEHYLPFAKNTKRSWRTDETVLRLHILPAIGSVPLDQVPSSAITKLISQMREKGYAAGTTNRVLVLLRYIFNLARKWNVPGAKENPTLGLNTAPEMHRERFLTAEEARRLIAAVEADENKAAAGAIMLLLLTGARRNEITQARWEYVEWEKRTLLVPVSKSGRPRRVALNGPAIALLRSLSLTASSPFIFPSAITGRPCPSLFFPWRRIRRRAGLNDLRLHDLRHSFASFLVNQGVSLYVVQGLLGHTQSRATQRYAHLVQQTLSDAAEVVATAIRAA
ncbi:MAG: tyrosine-type recombinase/integrase [Rhizobiales bacterium]|nr:tyrosine-type recombinase/integrase [Hyphomicrobiales bacterium]